MHDESARRMNSTKLNVQNQKVKLLEEMEKHVKAQIEYETQAEIRESIYEHEDIIAQVYKTDIIDKAHAQLIKELEPVVKSELAAHFEKQVKEQVISELKEELKAKLEQELAPVVKAGLIAELEPTVRADLEAEYRAQYDRLRPGDQQPPSSTPGRKKSESPTLSSQQSSGLGSTRKYTFCDH